MRRKLQCTFCCWATMDEEAPIGLPRRSMAPELCCIHCDLRQVRSDLLT